ncbi:MAG TPA: UDP-N-acetylmuramoyl-L-alanine--D-glutamate ligase [Geminicoccaceae bacterium]|nr:UDP-N-acetylmuramoyl-L-alanine--D-glutamate ligase [Geminicoccaceae bacterium]
MQGIERFRGRRVGVLGMARSGLALTRALRDAGAEVLAFDDRPEALPPALALGARPGAGEPVAGLGALVVSPGVPLTHPAPHPLVAAAVRAGVEVTGDVELFAAGIAPRPIVGVTGTNGKSTTTALLHHLLLAAGVDAEAGGNIGRPVFELEPGPPERVFVLELSSYQLDLCAGLRCRVACWLNLTPDHLDRHGDLAGYARAKRRIFLNQTAGDSRVIAIDDAPSRELADSLSGDDARLVRVSAEGDPAAPVRVEGDRLVDAMDGGPREVRDLAGIGALRGRHNHQNASVAYAAARCLGLAPERAAAGLSSFQGLAHRMEEVARQGRVVWVNDSKATNPDAAAKSLGAYEHVFWIAGGRPKPGGFADLLPLLGSVREAFLIGEAADQMARDLGGAVRVRKVETLERAVQEAGAAAAASGLDPAVVLLAPACASFDQFRSFEHRGDRFRELARDLTRERAA